MNTDNIKRINPIDAVLPIVAQAVAEWKATNSEEKIKKKVKDLLDSKAEEVTLKLLGFNNSWGKWELDHCNGRSGESAAGDFIQQVQQTAIKEWLSEVAMPTLDEKMKKSILKGVNAEVKRSISYQIQQLATNQANALMNKLLSDICVSDHVDNYLRTMKLIEGDNES